MRNFSILALSLQAHCTQGGVGLEQPEIAALWEAIMGPFPHDAPAATISKSNPAGTDGFEFVEFAHPEPEKLSELFTRMSYTPVAKHRTKDITVWRQGDINYVVNAEPGSHAMRFVEKHGPCAPSMAWRVVDAKHAFDHAVSKGATPYEGRRQDARRSGYRRYWRFPALLCRKIRQRRVQPMTRNLSGWANGIRNPAASASTISTTSPTMSIAVTWTSGGRSTANCSASSRSISSTLPEN